MYHTELPTDKTIREWYMNSSRVAACVLRNEQAIRAHRPGRPVRFAAYLPNFAPPHFAAHGIPKNTPHSKMEGHTAYIYMLSVYPFRM